MAALRFAAALLLLGGMGAAVAQGAHPFGVPESGSGSVSYTHLTLPTKA